MVVDLVDRASLVLTSNSLWFFAWHFAHLICVCWKYCSGAPTNAPTSCDTGIIWEMDVCFFRRLFNCWIESPRLEYSRTQHCSVNVKLFFQAGGDAFGRPTNAVECLNLKTEKWEAFPAMNIHRRRCAVVSVGEKLVVAGGLTLGDYSLDSVEMFDLRNRKWLELPNMPYPRFGCGACVIGSQMFLVGGNEKLWMKAYSSRVDCFDVMSKSWETLPSMAHRRLHPAAVSMSL